MTPGVDRGNDFSKATFAYGSNTDVGICAHVLGREAFEEPATDALADVEITVDGVGAGALEDAGPAPLLEEQAPVVTTTAIAPPIIAARWITT